MDRYLIKPGNSMKRKSTEEKDGGDTDKKLLKDSSATGFAFVQKKGDLFSCPDRDALAHCVSADFIMGKGIAVLFKQKFGGVQELKQQYRRPGSVAVLLRGPRFVYYLVTKERVRDKPTYENMQLSLEAMRRHCVENKVESVSMPRIGSGLDGLEWAKVSDIIKQVFSETDTRINVYTL